MEVSQLVLEHKKASKRWSSTNISSRINYLIDFKQLILLNSPSIIEIECRETGRSPADVSNDLEYSLSMLDHSILLLDRLQVKTAYNLGSRFIGTRYFPYGVIACITPWNFPLVVAFERIPYMLASGNSVIWKPAVTTSGSANIISRLFFEATQIPYVLSCLPLGPRESELLLKSGIDFISFTGSTRVGHAILTDISLANIPKSLELGGKNLAFMHNSANHALSVNQFISSFLRNSGHSCIQPSILYVDAVSYDLILSILFEQLDNWTVFQEPSPSFDYQRYAGVIDKLSSLGAGKLSIIQNPRSKLSPAAVVLEIEGDLSDLSLMEEFFCPVLIVVKSLDFKGDIARSKNSKYGLASLLFASDTSIKEYFVEHCSAGRLWINSEQYSEPSLRIGGLRGSGNSWIGGDCALNDYMYPKAIVSM